MYKLFTYFKCIAILVACCLLSACLGGTIAQQIARSIATSVADKTMAKAMDVDENEDYSESQYKRSATISAENNALQKNALQGASPQNYHSNQAIKLPDTTPDDVWLALATSGFREVKPITEPIPEQIAEVETPIQMIKGNQLVRVELYNLLIGDEKNAVYENARLMGSTSLPQKKEWRNWAVGTGMVQNGKQVITFLIPPEFGKLPSGTQAMVELASPGELNVARYKAN